MIALKRLRKEEAQGHLSPAEKRKLQRLARGYVLEVPSGSRPPRVDVMGYLAEEWEKAQVGDQVMSVVRPGLGVIIAAFDRFD